MKGKAGAALDKPEVRAGGGQEYQRQAGFTGTEVNQVMGNRRVTGTLKTEQQEAMG